MKTFSVLMLLFILFLFSGCWVGPVRIHYQVDNKNGYSTSIYLSKKNSVDDLRNIALKAFKDDCEIKDIPNNDYLKIETSTEHHYLMLGLKYNESNISYTILKSGFAKSTMSANAFTSGWIQFTNNEFNFKANNSSDSLLIELKNNVNTN